MLEYSGYSIAIANYVDEAKYCKGHKFPVIDIKNSRIRPNNSFTIKRKSKVHSFVQRIVFEYQQYRYARNFLKQIDGLSSNVYAGSFSLELSFEFVFHFKPNTNVFFWGLRSYHLTNFWTHFLRNPILGFKSIILNFVFRRKRNIKFFVSNTFIKEEFINLGITSNRLIVRQERTLFSLPNLNVEKLSSKFSLLTIGLIRRDKRLEFSIEAVKSIGDLDVLFFISGRSTNSKYENEIHKLIDNHSGNIIRSNHFLSTEEFSAFIETSHFLLLGDKKQLSTITNGTMMEALILNRPIIAPNYLPYSYYVSKYNIGFLYDPDNLESLTNTIKLARSIGVEKFIPNIREFQKSILFENVASQFAEDLKAVLDNSNLGISRIG